MKTWRKEISLLLVGMMMMSGLVAISAPAVIADTMPTNQENRFSVEFDDALMYDELIYDKDPSDNSYYLLGEGDGIMDYTATANQLDVQINLLNAYHNATTQNNLANIYLNLTPTGWDTDLFDVNDNDANRNNDIPGGAAWSPIAPMNGTTNTYTWMFDTLKTQGLGADDNTFLLRLTYQKIAPPSWMTTTFEVSIYLSSAFDDNTTVNDGAFGVLPTLVETTGGGDDARFEAGDSFTATQLMLHNYDPNSAITDVNCTITAPTGGKITFTNGKNTCLIPNGVGAMDTEALNYRMDIAAQTPPGVYEGTAVISYTRDDSGLRITEAAQEVEWEVDFSYIDEDPYTPATDAPDSSWSPFQCQATSVVILNDTRQIDYEAEYTVPTIEQSTYTDQMIRVNVTVHNNGNTPIYNVQFAVAPGTNFYPAPGAGWDFFRNPRFFWASVGAPANQYDSISQTFAQININQTITLTIEMVVAANIPIGVHRLPLAYDGFYYNDGSLGEATGFFPINGGDGVVLANDGDALNVTFAIEVVDEVIGCHVTAVTPNPGQNHGDKVDIRAETLTVTIMNDELYGFIDIIVKANFTGTPWYMPVINMRSPWVEATNANSAVPYTAWAAGGSMGAIFTVDTDSTMTPDRYPFQLEITAVIEQTLEVVTVVIDYTQGTVYDFTGYGPDVYITAFTAEDIVPGQNFDLALTLQNVGDDTLRDVTVMILTDGTDEYDWDLEADFKKQFDWANVFQDWGSQTGGTVTWEGEFPEEMFYTLEDLDVDNIREIVEINLYMDGVYSQPSAKISIVHILDLAPGATIDVTFEMITDKDMVNGKPYDFPVYIEGIGTDGVVWDEDRMITVQSSLPGDSYNPVELNWFDAGLKALALFLFFIIVLAILLFVYNMFKGDSYDEDEEDFDFEDDEPFEPTPAAPAKRESEELVEP